MNTAQNWVGVLVPQPITSVCKKYPLYKGFLQAVKSPVTPPCYPAKKNRVDVSRLSIDGHKTILRGGRSVRNTMIGYTDSPLGGLESTSVRSLPRRSQRPLPFPYGRD